jgi:hypothetical protein
MQYDISSQLLFVREQLALFGMLTSIDKKHFGHQKTNVRYHPGLNHNAEYGTFKDSLRAPIHRWFKYPAGYSYKLVREKIAQYKLNDAHWIFDPFVGSGTTSIEAKRNAVYSVGIEAHPFVSWVARTKLNWKTDLDEIRRIFPGIIESASADLTSTDTTALPDLVHKCYSSHNLTALVSLRNAIKKAEISSSSRDILNLALVAGYFSDMFHVVRRTFDALKPNRDFVLVLGDSAPYGIYIPTHEYLGRIGLALGFKSMQFEELRTRGDKWKDNPQRHKVNLKEVILTLRK